jgi:hypothetical protein
MDAWLAVLSWCPIHSRQPQMAPRPMAAPAITDRPLSFHHFLMASTFSSSVS